MASLKELRKRIDSIKSTQKITSAMKMIAAARLRKSQQLIGTSSYYAINLLNSAKRAAQEMINEEIIAKTDYTYPEMMRGNGYSYNYLLIVFSSDRGLCGGFNINVAKVAAARIEELKKANRTIKIICVGRKAQAILSRNYKEYIIETIEDMATRGADYEEASEFADRILEMYRNDMFDVCEIITSKFNSAVNREVKAGQLFPVNLKNYMFKDEADAVKKASPMLIVPKSTPSSLGKAAAYTSNIKVASGVLYDALEEVELTRASVIEKLEEWLVGEPVLVKTEKAYYEYEPGKQELLERLVMLIFKVTVFQAVVHSQASEHGARMVSMDNATRNAHDIIAKLTLKYNGLRQSAITTELIEIISGAEAI